MLTFLLFGLQIFSSRYTAVTFWYELYIENKICRFRYFAERKSVFQHNIFYIKKFLILNKIFLRISNDYSKEVIFKAFEFNWLSQLGRNSGNRRCWSAQAGWNQSDLFEHVYVAQLVRQSGQTGINDLRRLPERRTWLLPG